jgi:mRNA interferase RelE/StbE
LVSPSETPPGRTWRIEFTRTAERQITKLDHPAQKAIQRFLRERLLPAENPRQWGKPLHGEKRSLWRYRVGDYRLICDIQDEKVVVLVLEVGYRKEVYR